MTILTLINKEGIIEEQINIETAKKYLFSLGLADLTH